jgi:hypothetical protein
VINMSLGGGRSSVFERRAFDSLYNNNNILSIASAGNAGNTQTSYPAGYDSVVSVAAVNSEGVVADFSQKNSTVELSAPGVGVLSTVPFTEHQYPDGGWGHLYRRFQIEFAATRNRLQMRWSMAACATRKVHGAARSCCASGVSSAFMTRS